MRRGTGGGRYNSGSGGGRYQRSQTVLGSIAASAATAGPKTSAGDGLTAGLPPVPVLVRLPPRRPFMFAPRQSSSGKILLTRPLERPRFNARWGHWKYTGDICLDLNTPDSFCTCLSYLRFGERPMAGVIKADAAGVPVTSRLRNRAVHASPPPEDLLSSWLATCLEDGAVTFRSGANSPVALHPVENSEALHSVGNSRACPRNAAAGERSVTEVVHHAVCPDLDPELLNLDLSGCWQEDPDLDLDELGDWVPEWACRLSRKQMLDLEAAEAWRGLRALGGSADSRCGEYVKMCGEFVMCFETNVMMLNVKWGGWVAAQTEGFGRQWNEAY